MLIGMLLGLLAVMWRFPETPTARFLHDRLVEQPLRWVARCQRPQLIFAIVIAAMLLCGGEVIAIAGSFDLAVVMAWDLSLFVDAVIATSLVGAIARGRTVFRSLRSRWTAPAAPAVRRTRSRSRRGPRRPRRVVRTDDDDGAYLCDTVGPSWCVSIA